MVIRLLTTLLLAAGLVAACDNNDSSGDSSGEGGWCMTGETDCGCNISGGCNADDASCIGGTCVVCPPGTEGCACRNENPGCDDTLTCQVEDPECQLNCAAYCEAP